MERLTGFELGQDLLTYFFEVLGSAALAILEVEDNMVHADRTQSGEEANQDISPSAKPKVEWLRRGVRVISQIDVQRLSKRFQYTRCGGGHSGPPPGGDLPLLLE